ncbi:MAG TPA: DUF4124 domain-containing protein [Steroidobacteraceae bacterium]|nr:DUF4124 domain-containing protein [Steroidobacteraceae bacterium]
MKTTLQALALGAAMLLGSVAVRAADVMYSCTNAQGEKSLTNVPTNAQCERLFSDTAPPPAAAPVAGDTRAARQAARRSAAIKETADAYAKRQPGNVRNRALNRRYLMTNRADYIKNYGSKP